MEFVQAQDVQQSEELGRESSGDPDDTDRCPDDSGWLPISRKWEERGNGCDRPAQIEAQSESPPDEQHEKRVVDRWLSQAQNDNPYDAIGFVRERDRECQDGDAPDEETCGNGGPIEPRAERVESAAAAQSSNTRSGR